MFEKDYIMRMIFEILRFFIKAIFNKDMRYKEEITSEDLSISEDANKRLLHLRSMLDRGEINQAENLLYEDIDVKESEDFKLALLFYEYLNHMDSELIEESGYSYEKILKGVKKISELYGYNSLLDVFLS